MRQYIHIGIFIFTGLAMLSCIKRFDPDIKSNDAQKYVVTGGVHPEDSVQHISISYTSPLSKPRFIALPLCKAVIIDGNGNTYPAHDQGDGTYETKIPKTALNPGSCFKVDIRMPAGDHIVSDFDTILDSPQIESVIYRLKDIPTSNPFHPIRGIQFYVNLDARGFNCRNYRYEATETWQYTAPFYWVVEGSVCWLTMNVRSVFTVSTRDQSDNVYKMLPLNFVDNFSSQRLRYMYSLLVKQYSLSQAAYVYWNKIQINSLEQGGLYENQPFQVSGNLHNVTSPSQKVIGFFEASSVQWLRIFTNDRQAGLPDEYVDCRPVVYPEKDNPDCIDCRNVVGGTNKKPSFWPY